MCYKLLGKISIILLLIFSIARADERVKSGAILGVSLGGALEASSKYGNTVNPLIGIMSGYQYIKNVNETFNAGYRIYGNYDYEKGSNKPKVCDMWSCGYGISLGYSDKHYIYLSGEGIIDFPINDMFAMGIYFGGTIGVMVYKERGSLRDYTNIAPLFKNTIGMRFVFQDSHSLELGIIAPVLFIVPTISSFDGVIYNASFLARYVYTF